MLFTSKIRSALLRAPFYAVTRGATQRGAMFCPAARTPRAEARTEPPRPSA